MNMRSTPGRPGIASYAWCVFVFLLPVNGWINESIGEGLPAVSNLALVLTLIIAVVSGSLLNRMPPVPAWLFLSYAAMLGITLFFIEPNMLAAGFRRFCTIGLMVAAFWMSSHFCADDGSRRRTLWAITLGGILLGLLTLSGLAQDELAYKEIRRVFVSGYQANDFAFYLSLSLVSLLILNLSLARPSAWLHGASLLGGVVLFRCLAQSGSRGMLAAFGAAAVVVALTSGTRRAALMGGVVLVGMGGAVLYLWQTDASFVSRWTGAIEKQDLAGRQFILPAVLNLFFEKPILGWGVVQNFAETAQRVRPDLEFYDTHNSFLCVLTELGVVGFLFWATGVVLCIWRSFLPDRDRGRSCALGLFAFFVVSSMTNDQLASYLSWVVLGICFASVERFDPFPVWPGGEAFPFQPWAMPQDYQPVPPAFEAQEREQAPLNRGRLEQ
jgi:O-antigen ligase